MRKQLGCSKASNYKVGADCPPNCYANNNLDGNIKTLTKFFIKSGYHLGGGFLFHYLQIVVKGRIARLRNPTFKTSRYFATKREELRNVVATDQNSFINALYINGLYSGICIENEGIG